MSSPLVEELILHGVEIIVDMVRFTYIIDIIKKENLIENAAQVGGYFMNALSQLKGLKNVRGKGLMIAFDLATTTERDKLKSIIQEKMLVLTMRN